MAEYGRCWWRPATNVKRGVVLDNLAGQFCTSAISGQPNTNTSPDWTITHVDIFGAGFCSSTVCKEGVDFTLTVDQRY